MTTPAPAAPDAGPDRDSGLDQAAGPAPHPEPAGDGGCPTTTGARGPAQRIDVITLFPDICLAPLGESILGRARREGLIDLNVHDLREFGLGRHRRVDDEPYGGGPGMVLRPEPLFAAFRHVRDLCPDSQPQVLFMTPQGRRLDQALARELSACPHLIILCAAYEGVDHRVIEALVDLEVSIGDYVLTNGALAAAVLIDAVARLRPGVLGDDQSAVHESFSDGLLEAPHYTRPHEFDGRAVPPVLLSGDHARIAEWRGQQAVERTRQNRPDLLS